MQHHDNAASWQPTARIQLAQRNAHVRHKSRKIELLIVSSFSAEINGLWTCLPTISMLPAVFCCYSLQVSIPLFSRASHLCKKYFWFCLWHKAYDAENWRQTDCRMYSTNTSCPRAGFGETSSQQLLQDWQASSQPSTTSQCQDQLQCEAIDKYGMRPLYTCSHVVVFVCFCVSKRGNCVHCKRIRVNEFPQETCGRWGVAFHAVHRETLLTKQKPDLTVIVLPWVSSHTQRQNSLNIREKIPPPQKGT